MFRGNSAVRKRSSSLRRCRAYRISRSRSSYPRKHYTVRLLVALVSTAVLASIGCGLTQGFSGSQQNEAELAVVRAHGVRFVSINDIPIGPTSSGVIVIPGNNLLELTIDESNFNSRGPNGKVYRLPFVAVAGKAYAVTGRRGDSRLCAWEVSEVTGDPIFENPAGCIQQQ